MQATTVHSQYTGEECRRKFLVLRSGSRPDQRVGIYARGGCDLPAIFACAPLIEPILQGSCCISHEGLATDSRSDALLQTLSDIPRTHVQPIIDRLKLSTDYFDPVPFEPTFTIQTDSGLETFPKTVTIISIGADVVRIAYRHREHGFLVDPGGIWLGRPMEEVLGDVEAAKWFRENFVSDGRLEVEDFIANMTRLVTSLRERTSGHVLVLNCLNPEPRGLTHTYQLYKDPLLLRRRAFNLALLELSRSLDFSIIDINRTAQRAGIRDQVDWIHTHPLQYLPIAQEIFRIMVDLKVFPATED
jgi:hypothetical protein